MTQVYLNGRFINQQDAMVSVMDRGFMFADGAYEVIPAFYRVPFRIDQHLARLDFSLSSIRIENPLTHEQWRGVFDQLLAENAGEHQSIYLQVTRGVAADRNHLWPKGLVPTVLVMTSPLKMRLDESLSDIQGITAMTTEDLRWKRCDIKAIALLPNVLHRQRAEEAGADEAILINEQDQVTEGSSSNVFIVKGNEIATPPKTMPILGGITRDLVIELLQADTQYKLSERMVLQSELRNADEVWITSSTKEICPVTMLDSQPVGNGNVGPVWHDIAARYQQYKLQLAADYRKNPPI
ncbi:D-amino acid aminotransferase [Zooshikella marina]|uniref:D-amino acid aminotransferase n=1 Tax=Zooshikella ganghwensis TaxID=202772 RepID=UPI001BAFC03D|nr:D-amino acid aminotransferase [Zooshikella ganghwensis]MBU2708387.1 D-amino acid aminotransferase [Zooshikella ganghwensis]